MQRYIQIKHETKQATLVCWSCMEEAMMTGRLVRHWPSIPAWKSKCEVCGKEEVNYRRPRSDYEEDVTAATDPEMAMEEAYDEGRY